MFLFYSGKKTGGSEETGTGTLGEPGHPLEKLLNETCYAYTHTGSY